MKTKTLKLPLALGLALVVTSAALASSGKHPEKEPTPPSNTARALVQTDIDGVYSNDLNPISSSQFWLTPGLYDVGEVNGTFTDSYMLVDTSANNDQQYLVILFDKDAFDSSRTVQGHMYQGRRIKNGTTVMLSPLNIDRNGNLQVASEARRDAPVVEMVTQPGQFSFPIMMIPRNGALGGHHMGARVSTRRKPELMPFPSAGVFASGSKDDPDVIVRDSVLSISGNALTDSTFRIVPLNGSVGKFAGLVRSKLDTMAETETSKEQIESLAVFINGVFDQEVLLYATGTATEGDFNFHFYKRSSPGIIDYLFSGDRFRK